MSQRVRVHGGLRCGMPRPGPQATSDVGRGQPAAGLGQEQRGLPAARVERAARTLEIARDRAQGVLSDGDEPGLAALALDADLLAVEVDRADVEVHELLRAQAAGVGELEERAVALLERRGGGD